MKYESKGQNIEKGKDALLFKECTPYHTVGEDSASAHLTYCFG